MAIDNVKNIMRPARKRESSCKTHAEKRVREVYILYVKQLTDVEMLTQNVIRPIQKYWQERVVRLRRSMRWSALLR